VVTIFVKSTAVELYLYLPYVCVKNLTEWRLHYLQEVSLVALIDLTYGVPVFPVRIISYRNMQ